MRNFEGTKLYGDQEEHEGYDEVGFDDGEEAG